MQETDRPPVTDATATAAGAMTALSAPPPAGAAGMLLRWLQEGARTALLRHARWDGLHARPAMIVGLLAVSLLLMFVLQRLWVVGPASFYWQPLLVGWLAPAATAWACYALLHPADGSAPAHAPSAAHLFCLLQAQGCLLAAVYGLLWAIVIQSGGGMPPLSPTLLWGIWISLWVWLGAAQTLTFWRGTPRKGRALALAVLLLALGLIESGSRQETLWVAEAGATAAPEPTPRRLVLTQELMEQQPLLLGRRLQALQAQRPGIVDLYALTFAPYAHEDVFRRESEMVAGVMAQRFDSAGRSLQLVNHATTVDDWPWATPLNLQRAIRHLAGLMDRDEDILFIHLTSHGAQDGQLAAQFWPLSVAAVTPQQLKAWLDEAGIRHRVISVSACYSGSWIAPLRDDNTLVMTAADAEHTSFGCGRQSELTYFGRAIFDEQLRTQTRSFEAAHAAARPLIEQREREAGKDDGYSNPQIDIGSSIRERLERMRRQLETG
ncbi:MAG: hypothetical protein HYU78_16030 [Rhodocyclales bacterium]|nr:hypothetical protein [Rhodocyclales bacterium]